MGDLVIKANGVRKSYLEANGQSLPILKGVDLALRRGERLAIVGESGSGKSTLLEVLATLLPFEEGTISILGKSIAGLSEKELSTLRGRHLGFIFQNSQLLSDFTALENVMMPALIAGSPAREAKEQALKLLETVGLKERADHHPDTLSGGERQRVAVARALVNKPEVMFADEPTGSLDEGHAHLVEDLLLSLPHAEGTALVLVTHNNRFAERCDRVLRLRDGVLS